MKYDADIDPAEANTSHVQVLDLVGTGQRVLDVGCSTGYLARALGERDNTVSGVEVDADAAAVARPHLAELLVGDLETLDLVAELGEGRFDVIVFADVLEHLTNPLRVLRQAPALLAPGGSVVVSIPNVAHGAVRLALLQGRFEYRELGLLDDTHVRFFTRSSVAELHEQAGLTPVDVRRTVLGPFDTEIPVQAADFPAEVIERVQADPEATTYQFVIRSVPTLTRAAGSDLGEELVARNQELEEARAQLRAYTHLASDPHQPFVAGVVVPVVEGPDAPAAAALDELRAMVVARELGRRLDGWTVRIFEAGRDQGRPATDGGPLWPLTPTPAGYRQASDGLDVMVATGAWPASAQLARMVEGMGDAGCPFHLAGGLIDDEVEVAATPGATSASSPILRPPAASVGFAGTAPPDTRQRVVADPLVLADRLFDAELLANRASYLRFAGALPKRSPHLLVHIGPPQGAEAGSVARALEELASAHDLSVAVIADAERDPKAVFATDLADRVRGATVAEGLAPVDLVAAVSSAALVISDDAGVLWLAVALGRAPIGLAETPSAQLRSLAAWLGDPDTVATSPASLLPGWALAQRRAEDVTLARNACDDLELFLDELVGVVATIPAGRLPASLPTRLAEARNRVAVLEGVNGALHHSLRKLRLSFGEEARKANLGDGSLGVPLLTYQGLEERLHRAEAELHATRRELDAAMATRTMRTLAPARKVYGRLRRLS